MSDHQKDPRLPAYGFVFIVLLAVALTAAAVKYAGGFDRRPVVTIHAETSASQLGPGAQVKYHGVVIGRVDGIDTTGEHARITLKIDEESLGLLPENVHARILPKSLIGQSFVDLVPPRRPSARALAAGDVIERDRSETAIELEHALNNLLVTLHKVPPQKLAVALNSLSSALDGRGEKLGETLEALDTYLGGLNPSVPLLVDDLRALARTSDTYAKAAPELLAALRDLSTTTRTVADKRSELLGLYRGVIVASRATEGWFRANGGNLVALVTTARRTLELLARYAPQLPCMLGQLHDLVPRIDAVFGKGERDPMFRISLQVTPQRGPYKVTDKPRYDDTRGPRCYPVMRIAPQYPDGVPIQDGAHHPPAARSGGN